jgi:hypothetical protein
VARNLSPDPGGVFDSDAHRRVLAFLRAPTDDGHDPESNEPAHEPGAPMLVEGYGWEKSLTDRTFADASFVSSGADISKVLSDLEADGFVAEKDGGYVMTAEGFAALNGPNGNEPPPMTEMMVNAMHADGTLTDDELALWRAATEES